MSEETTAWNSGNRWPHTGMNNELKCIHETSITLYKAAWLLLAIKL